MSFHFLFVLHYCCCPLICISPATGWKKMELKFGQSCNGAVFVHSHNKTSAVSSDGWTEKEGNRLCHHLKCGAFKSNSTKKPNDPFWNNSFSCDDEKDKTIWECEKGPLPDRDHQQLVIECQGTFFFFNFCIFSVKSQGWCSSQVIANLSLCIHQRCSLASA